MSEEKITEEIKSLKIGDFVKGTIIALNQKGVYLDLDGLATGIVRGPELFDESGRFSNLKKGKQVLATVMDIENEKGLLELSFRYASHKKAWEELKKIFQSKKNVPVKVLDANRGGLIVEYNRTKGFLPVSQLKAEHYPHVKDGNKTRILEKLRDFINQELKVKIIGFDEAEEKLVFSEKQTRKKEKIEHQINDVVKVKITGLTNFGAFAKLNDGGEGLIHISELAWKKIENPEEIVKIGDELKVKIISFTPDGKASLSIKDLSDNPWEKVKEKYKVGQTLEGKVLKINSFGLFVGLDETIHGLAHISEIPLKESETLEGKFKEGEIYQFKIISLEPEDRRLSLSLIK